MWIIKKFRIENKMVKIIKDMLKDDTKVLNARTIKEAELFVDLCDELHVEYKSPHSLTGKDFFSVYKENLCFTLEKGTIEYCDIQYFKECRYKDYKIITLDD